VLDTGPKVRGSNPGRGDGFLRAINISNTPYFGEKVKPEAPCLKILLHVKESSMNKNIPKAKFIIPFACSYRILDDYW
jgi:hypothetical protein